MSTVVKKFIYYVLIANYCLAATAGNVVVLRELLNSGNAQYQLTSEKQSRPIQDAPVWTMKNCTQPVLHSDVSLHISSSINIIPCIKRIAAFIDADIPQFYSSLECLPSKPRDPPRA